MSGRTTNVWPGFIVGPRDSSNRFLFYPLRVRRGGEMVLPGSPEDPIQIIDVRDLGAWIVRTIEDKTVGVFNATGPAETLTMKAMVEGCRKGAGSSTTFAWETEEALSALGSGADGMPLYHEGSFPLYVPPAGEGAGFHKCDCSKAIAKGLTFRSVEETAKTTLAWYDSIPAEVQKGITRFPMTEERQDALVAAWKASKKK
jgi:2'-hydroxyisoflavone reductase